MSNTSKEGFTVENVDGVATVISPEGEAVRSYPESAGGETYAFLDADDRNGLSPQ